ncbi:hypothetical protein JL721_1058 [Aureococcus anophagefferens]|nr:hypothetical protein JL721_1058 [Aureococcus anophagefferens]
MIAFDRRRRRLPRVPVVSKYVEYVGELWRADEASTARSDVVEVGRGTTLATRVTTGVGLGLLFTYWTMVPNWAFALGMLLQALVAQLEYFRMAIIRGARPARRIVMAASIAAMAVAAGAPALHELVFPVGATWMMLWLCLMRKHASSIQDISTSLMGLFYTAYLPSFWVRLRCAPEWTMAAANLAPEGALASVAAAAAAHVPLLRHAGAQAVWWTALTVAVSDIGAYFGGKRFGRHSLAALGLGAAAEASPNKTIEGAISGFAAAGLCFGLGARAMGWPLWPLSGVGFGVTIAMLALLGDLTASMLKRDAGVKDFGHLFPATAALDRPTALSCTGFEVLRA